MSPNQGVRLPKVLASSNHLDFSCSKYRVPPGELAGGGLVEFCAGDKGQVGGRGGFLGVESCLEHHGSLEERPGFWGKMEKRIFKFKFSKVLISSNYNL